MALALEFAPLLIGVPFDPPLSLVVAVVLGGLMATRPAPAWPIVCVGVAMLVTANTLSIPPEVLALAKVPSLPQPGTLPMQMLAGIEMLVWDTEPQRRLHSILYAVLAARYLAAEGWSYQFGVRLVVLAFRVLLGRGNSLLVCASMLGSICLEGATTERALWLLASWLLARVLQEWLVELLALVTAAQYLI